MYTLQGEFSKQKNWQKLTKVDSAMIWFVVLTDCGKEFLQFPQSLQIDGEDRSKSDHQCTAVWSTTLTVINKKFVLSQKQIFQESVFFHLSFVRFPAHSINDLFLSEVVKSRFTKVSLLLIPKGSKSAPVVFSKMKNIFCWSFDWARIHQFDFAKMYC